MIILMMLIMLITMMTLMIVISINSIFQWLTNFSNFWCTIGFGFDKICATLSSICFWFGTLLYERKKMCWIMM